MKRPMRNCMVCRFVMGEELKLVLSILREYRGIEERQQRLKDTSHMAGTLESSIRISHGILVIVSNLFRHHESGAYNAYLGSSKVQSNPFRKTWLAA